MSFSLNDYDYRLPPELIAQYPLPDRQSCRLMVVDRSRQSLEHRRFSDLPAYLQAEDVLVINDSRVRPCRLFGRRPTGGKVEIFLLRRTGPGDFDALISPGGRVKEGEKIVFADSAIWCQITGRNRVRFPTDDQERIYRLGRIPLPPYIKRAPETLDEEYYQTVYAAVDGSVAAPTAGLHFTPGLLDSLRRQGVVVAPLTLHVGQATFKPVSAEDVRQHRMGVEEYSLGPQTRQALETAGHSGRKVCAVGTTSCRALETYISSGSPSGSTDMYIYPGYRFQCVSMLLTNFHLPRTTLFLLVCAFAGTELAKKAYQTAVQEKYRFYSYGDAMLIV